MTYDFHDGGWGEKVSGHHTNLYKSPYGVYSADEAIKAWISLGAPKNKLFIGAAFYSRGFANTNGLGQPCSGGSPDKSWEAGVVDYKALPLPGAVELWDDVAKAGYSYDATKKVLNSYDTVQSVQEKCKYINNNNLGGIIVWESSGDLPFSNPKSLMRVIHDNLTHGGSPIVPTPVVPVTPTPVPVTPTPVPVTPVPTSYSCDFCTTCRKTSVAPCVARKTPLPIPIPTPVVPTPVSSDTWGPSKSYKVNDIVTYQGKKYICIQSHNSLSVWSPNVTPTLWKEVL
jgi:chitinase